MYKTLADFVKELEINGELIRISSPVSSELEIAEITDRMVKTEGGGKALLFEKTDKGFPVLTNLYGSFLGKPVIKLASTFYAMKVTAQSFLHKNQANKASVVVEEAKGE